MAVTENRLPPNRRRNFSITTPGIPWYRDIKVLQILMQLTFLVLFFGGIFIAFYSLYNNLKESNLAMDFNVYERPFGPAISEGPAPSEEWAWAQEVFPFERMVWVLLTIIGFGLNINLYQQGKLPFPAAVGGVALMAVVLIFPPTRLDSISTERVAWMVLFGGLSALAVGTLYQRKELQPLTAGALAVVIIALLLLVPMQGDWLAENLQKYFVPNTISRAFMTGVYNTLRVVVASLVACTILGILVGIGLLSKNFLVRNICVIYVEIFRNTPLLVQLLLIYRAMTEVLPRPRNSYFSPDQLGPFTFHEKFYALNIQGLYLASPRPTDTAWLFFLGVTLGLIVLWVVRRWRLQLQEETGTPANTWQYGVPIMVFFALAGWLLAGGFPLGDGPFKVSYPALEGPRVVDGTGLTVAFVALFLGLTLYTAAFIADIVRAGIQAVPFGQIEAARSQGFSGSQVLGMVVLPQALRLIIPPLGNQYVNLGKNSSLATAVTYVDLYRAAALANNETGQAVPVFVALMITYLIISLCLSFLTNLLNKTTKLRTR